MKNLILTLLILAPGLSFAASSNQLPNLDGTYIYQGTEEYVRFPSRNLDGDTGYADDSIVPTPIWVQLAPNSQVTIKTTKDGYVFTHLPMRGTMLDPQRPNYVQTLVSFSAINNIEHTRSRVIQNGFQIGIKRRVGFGVVGGENVEVIVQQKSNGDIEVIDNRTGWALIPSPLPIHEDIAYTLKRIK